MFTGLAGSDITRAFVAVSIRVNGFARRTAVAAFGVGIDAVFIGSVRYGTFIGCAFRIMAGAAVAMLVSFAWMIAASAMVVVGAEIGANGVGIRAAVFCGICACIGACRGAIVIDAVSVFNVSK